MARVELNVEISGIYSFKVPAYGYGPDETMYIYKMIDETGTVYVWKTKTFWCYPVYDGVDPDTANFFDSKGRAYDPQMIVKGDKLVIAATVKGQSEYNGQTQTELQRVKAKDRIFHAKSYQDIQREKKAEKDRRKQEQLDSIGEHDFVWTMPYKQYKEHYSDCETLIDSFVRPDERLKYGVCTIKVIIREGRLKASGVRGEHFSGYGFSFTYNGERTDCVFRAVCEDNALHQLEKQFRGATDIKLVNIYR